MRVKNSFTTSLTKTGKLRVKTRTKVPMMPAFTTSTTFGARRPSSPSGTSGAKGGRKKKR